MRIAVVLSLIFMVSAGLSCGEDDAGSGGGGPGGDGGAGAMGGAGGADGGGGEGGGGNAGTDGNDSFASATPVSVDDDVEAAIDPIAGDVDYYSFVGSAGQWLAFGVDAVPDPTPRDRAHIDSVVTLYDENQTQIAFNDDPFPVYGQDALEHTRLPADGTYFLMVEEWCNTTEGQGQCPVGWESERTDHSYRLILRDLDDAAEGLVEELEPNDTPAEAKALEFPPGPSGSYDVLTYDYGLLEPGGVDVFSFVVPTEADFFGYAAGIWIPHFFTGPDKNGSTSAVGPMWIVHEASQEVVARVEMPGAGQSLSPPITPGETYHLFVEAPAGALGDNPFYVLFDTPYLMGQPEQDEAGNGTTPEAMAALSPQLVAEPAVSAWIFTGDIIDPSDEDRFVITMPASPPATAVLDIECLAERRGSGLRDFHMVVEKGSDNSEWLSDTESATHTIAFRAETLPPGETSLVFDLSAPTSDAMNPSTYYRCQVVLYDPSP